MKQNIRIGVECIARKTFDYLTAKEKKYTCKKEKRSKHKKYFLFF